MNDEELDIRFGRLNEIVDLLQKRGLYSYEYNWTSGKPEPANVFSADTYALRIADQTRVTKIFFDGAGPIFVFK